MPKGFASPQEIAPEERLDIEQPAYGPKPDEALPNASRSEFEGLPAPLPRTSLSLMMVMDENGSLTPLCTAGDLLRWCKAAWKAEQDKI
jgi:hypothetical protein